ncbi:hypothetical protein BJ165DRAFT_239503 [Panaeolus papilionaceus]|nr:hypothetical protein BJ165DRAFT_239503 [Panaeolus papilionaceus]
MASGLVHIDLSDTIGILEIGSLFSVFLFGIVTLQAHFYYTTYRDDGWREKALVGALWLMELGHTVGVAFEVYRATITLYGRPHLLITFPALSSVMALGGAITFAVQTFFALRVSRLIAKPYGYIGFLCIGVSFLRFIGSVVLAVAAATSVSIAIYRVKWKWLIVTLLSSATAVDLIIAISMLYYLRTARSRALSRTTHLIDKLIGYTLRSGLLTSVSAVVLLICFLSKPLTMSWLAVYTFLAKLYSNSLLSVLNGREELRNDGSHSASAISIEMKTTTETTQDMDDKRQLGSPYLGVQIPPSRQPV